MLPSATAKDDLFCDNFSDEVAIDGPTVILVPPGKPNIHRPGNLSVQVRRNNCGTNSGYQCSTKCACLGGTVRLTQLHGTLITVRVHICQVKQLTPSTSSYDLPPRYGATIITQYADDLKSLLRRRTLPLSYRYLKSLISFAPQPARRGRCYKAEEAFTY
jgi:hypothetical protein